MSDAKRSALKEGAMAGQENIQIVREIFTA